MQVWSEHDTELTEGHVYLCTHHREPEMVLLPAITWCGEHSVTETEKPRDGVVITGLRIQV